MKNDMSLHVVSDHNLLKNPVSLLKPNINILSTTLAETVMSSPWLGGLGTISTLMILTAPSGLPAVMEAKSLHSQSS